VLWAALLLAFPLLASVIPANMAARFGAIGDMFGAGAALFGGLGFMGLTIVLFYDIEARKRDLAHRFEDLEERRRTRRPYLLTTVPAENLKITRAVWSDQHLDVTAAIGVQLENLTDEPALNIEVVAVLESSGVSMSTQKSELPPMGSTGTASANFHHALSGQVALELLQSLERGADVWLRVEAGYESLNGAGWVSSAKFRLTCPGVPDRQLLARLTDSSSNERIESGGSALGSATGPIYVTPKPVQGFWKQAAT
jgi:hypothetical protein